MKTPPAKSKKPAVVKMSDLAKLAGVSKATVSRALSGSELINPATRARIQALAKQYNYRLNTQARNFRLKESLTITVIIPSAESAKWQISDPFFLELLGSISVCLMEKGHEMLLSAVDFHLPDKTSGLSKINSDGIIVIGQSYIHKGLNEYARSHPQLVVWGARMEDQDYCCVGGDNLRGGLLATQHLIERGCKHIAIIGDREVPEGNLRYQGYLRALQDAGIERNPALEISIGSQKNEGYDATLLLLTRGVKFDGIFLLSDALAMASINALDEHGIAVPKDVAIVGYDDISLARYYTPSITSVHQDREIGGRLLVEKLLQLIDGQEVESFTMPTNLVVRKSSKKTTQATVTQHPADNRE